MAEVFEITRKALNDLLTYGVLDTNYDLDGAEWVTVKGFCFFGRFGYHPVRVYGVRDTESDAVWSADFNNNLTPKLIADNDLHIGSELEVWHIVDDEPDECDDDFTSRYELRVYYADAALGVTKSVETFDTLLDAEKAADLVGQMAWETVVRCEVWDTFADGPESFCYSNTCI